MTLENARQALLGMKAALAQDPAMLDEIEAFILELRTGIASGELT
jgi:hypothetical protein